MFIEYFALPPGSGNGHSALIAVPAWEIRGPPACMPPIA